jgi:hypothetical protein
MSDSKIEELIKRNRLLLEKAERIRQATNERANRSSTKRINAQREHRSSYTLIYVIYGRRPERRL